MGIRKMLGMGTGVVALALVVWSPARADNLTACGAVMCLYGDATGHGGGSQCNKYENPYYQIQVFTWGVFDPQKTLDARGNFLKQCTSADTQTIHVANSNGTSEWGPLGPPRTPPGQWGHCPVHAPKMPAECL